MTSTSTAPKPVTPRQQEAARLAAQALTYQEIGDAMGISKHTVRAHIIRLADRLPGGDSSPPLKRVRQWMRARQTAA